MELPCSEFCAGQERGKVSLRIQAGMAYAGSSALMIAAMLADPAYAQTEAEHAEEAETEIVVQATRTGRRVQDEPIRVEVINREEIEEKLLMRPGNIATLVSETPGVRVQTTSPALGAANVRIQGSRAATPRSWLTDCRSMAGRHPPLAGCKSRQPTLAR